MRKFVAALFFALSLITANAQIGTANFTYQGAFSLNSGDVLSLSMQIVGCGNGNLPKYNNLPISTTPNQTNLQGFTASGTQLVTATLPGNDKITCSTQSYTSYAATWLDNGFPIAPTQTFRLIDGSTVSLNTTPAIGFVPPILQNAAGVYCPLTSAPVFLGFNANYTPNCVTVAAAGFAPAIPVSGGTVLGNLLFQYPFGPSSAFINGIPQADQFPGADMCAKVRAAAVYAVANSINLVDATHFTGTQVCATNMFVALNATGNADINLAVNFGAVHIRSSVIQSVTNSGLHIQGAGVHASILEYIGTGGAQILLVDGTTGSGTLGANGLNNFQIRDFAIWGDNSGAGDGIVLKQVHRSEFANLFIWGVSTSGIHTLGAVTDTFYRIHVSNIEAAYFGINGVVPTPVHEFLFDAASGNKTTDGTVIDAMAEGVGGTGWLLQSANSMTFTGGTVEGSVQGVTIVAGSQWNTFIGPDIEGNTQNSAGVDINDNGLQTRWINPIANSTCSGACAQATAGGGGAQIIDGIQGIGNPPTGSFNILDIHAKWTATGSIFEVSNITLDAGISGIGSIGLHNSGNNTFIFADQLEATHNITNAVGFQLISAASCSITAGAIGNFCSTVITFTSAGGVAEPDTAYKAICAAVGGASGGLWGVADAFNQTTTQISVNSVAFSTTATAATGTINCWLIHL